MEFGEKLRTLRREKGLSQEELAAMVGVSRQALSKWEAGQSRPELDKLLALSDIFSVTMDSLVRPGGPEPQPASGQDALPRLWNARARCCAYLRQRCWSRY